MVELYHMKEGMGFNQYSFFQTVLLLQLIDSKVCLI